LKKLKGRFLFSAEKSAFGFELGTLPLASITGYYLHKNQIPQKCRAALAGFSSDSTTTVTVTTNKKKQATTTKEPGEQLSKHACVCVPPVRECVGAFVCVLWEFR